MKNLVAVVCLFALVHAPAVLAAECDNAYPWYYDATSSCDRSNTEGICRLSQPVQFSLSAWVSNAPATCATVEWSFGDGSPVVTANGAASVGHTYANAGVYRVRAVIRTSRYPGTITEQFDVTVANGMLRWQPEFVVEGGTATYKVTRTNTTGATQLNWRITGPGGVTPTDVSPAGGTVVLPDGVAVATFQVTALNNSAFSGASRTYSVQAAAATGGFIAPEPTSLTIEDDDYPVLDFAAREFRTIEQNGVVTITVNRSAGDPNVRVSTAYSVPEGTGIVSTFGTLVFEPGVMSRTFNVVTLDDDSWSGDRSIRVELRSPTGGARYPNNNPYSHTATLIVVENDPLPSFRVSDVRVSEGDEGVTRGTFVIETSEPIFANVSYIITAASATAGADYRVSFPTGFVSFSPHVRRATIPFDVIGDKEIEGDEIFRLVLRFPSPSRLPLPAPATATIVNDDAGLGPRYIDVARGAAAYAYLNIGPPAAAPVVVALQSSNSGIVAVAESLTIPPGAANVEIELHALAVGTATIEVRLPASLGGKVLTTIVRVYDPARLTFDPTAVHVVAGQHVPVRLKLERPPDRPLTLPVSVLNSKVARVPAEVAMAADGTGTLLVEGRAPGFTVVRVTLPGELGSEIVSLDVHVTPAGDSPSLAAINPATGPSAGGTAFTATGSKLTPACTLSFGGSPASAIKAASDGTLSGVTPAHAAGTVDVTLTCGAATFVLPRAFTYLDVAPELSSLAPTFGTTKGGTLVRATGANFRSGCWMFFGDVPANRVDVDSTSILTASAPAAAAALVSTAVRCGAFEAGLPSSFAYTTATEPAAAILSVSPLVGAPGESVTVSGLRFRSGDRITFDDIPASILRTRSDQHVVRVPELPLGMAAITVTDGDGRVTTTGPIFTVVEPLPPQITSVTPARALPGSEIVLEGRGFRPGYAFAIGGVPAPAVTFAYDRVTLRIPAAVEPGDRALHVLNAAGRIAAVGPTVKIGSGALRLATVAPACGSTEGATSIIVTGAGFADGAVVTVNGAAATDVVVVSATEIRATTPIGPTGDAVVRVANADGNSAAVTGAFRYASPFDPQGCAQSSRTRAVRP